MLLRNKETHYLNSCSMNAKSAVCCAQAPLLLPSIWDFSAHRHTKDGIPCELKRGSRGSYCVCSLLHRSFEENEIVFDEVMKKTRRLRKSPPQKTWWHTGRLLQAKGLFHSVAPKADAQWTRKPFQLNSAILDDK